jgi:hypothetical protein
VGRLRTVYALIVSRFVCVAGRMFQYFSAWSDVNHLAVIPEEKLLVSLAEFLDRQVLD